MDKLEFATVAVSKDETRYNLTSVYRDTDHYVGTDGHRMHIAESSHIDKGMFVDGKNAEFPTWQQVIPKKSPVVSATLNVNKELVERLEALAKIGKSYGNPAYRLELEDGHFKVIGEFGKLDSPMSIRYTVDCVTKGRYIDPSRGLNLNYLIDALKCFLKFSKKGAQIEIEAYDDYAPWKFHFEPLGTAYISPCKM